jgi:hypothetical protein
MARTIAPGQPYRKNKPAKPAGANPFEPLYNSLSAKSSPTKKNSPGSW